jgi:hypothetical protein
MHVDKYMIAIVISIEGWLYMGFFMMSVFIMSNIFIYEILEQKEIRLKRGLSNAGLHPVAFWMACFVCDYIIMMIPVFFFMMIIWGGNIGAVVYKPFQVFILMVTFTFPFVPCCYLGSLVFHKAERATRSLSSIFILMGYVGPAFMTGVQLMKCSTSNIIITTLSIIHPFLPFYDAITDIIFSYIVIQDVGDFGVNIFC